jgi:ribosome-associated toxin RatA of RatAB toxin-antitoxin module
VTTLRGGTVGQFELHMPGRRTRSACQVFSRALMLGAALMTMSVTTASAEEIAAETEAADVPPPVAARPADVTVREQDGVFHVTATFSVPQSASVVFDVLTGYEQIPRFMPDVRSSRVIERGDGHALVEQEAVAHVMLFSKRIHLVLEISEAAERIQFRDRCGKSFARYEGAWNISTKDAQSVIAYELSAKPAFHVPEFLLRRLLKRDAQEMIRRLKDEIGRVADGHAVGVKG